MLTMLFNPIHSGPHSQVNMETCSENGELTLNTKQPRWSPSPVDLTVNTSITPPHLLGSLPCK